MSNLAETRRMNEIEDLLGDDNFDVKYQKVAYWDGQPCVIGKNELKGFYFELAGCGYIGNAGCLENAITGSRKLFNDYFRKLSSLRYEYLYGEDAGNLEACFDNMREMEEYNF